MGGAEGPTQETEQTVAPHSGALDSSGWPWLNLVWLSRPLVPCRLESPFSALHHKGEAQTDT